MNWFLPYKCLFCQPYFFFLYQLNFFAKGIVDSVVEAEHLFETTTTHKPEKNLSSADEKAVTSKFVSQRQCEY